MPTTVRPERGSLESHRHNKEAKIVEAQLHFDDVHVSFFSLFRYAKASHCLIVAISTISALGAGALIPLPAVLFGQLSNTFAGVENNVAQSSTSSHQISYYALYYVYLSVGALALWFISIAGFSYAGSQISEQIRMRYLKAVIRQNMGVFDDIGTGSLVSALGADLNAIQDAVSHKLSIVLSSFGTLMATYVVSFALQWKLTLMMTWSFFLSLALLYLGNLIAGRYSKRSTEAQSAGSSIAEETLGSIRSITALGLQNHVISSYDQQLEKAERAGYTLKSLMGIMVAVTVGTGYLNVALAFWQGSLLLVGGQISFASLVAITLITKSAAFCVLGVGHNAEAFTTATAAAHRIFRMISREPPIDSMANAGYVPDEVRGKIDMQNIKHIYPTRPGVTVAENLSIAFPNGKITAVVGTSGSGKSSIAKLILRFYNPVNGQIMLDNHRLEDLNIKWLRGIIRLVSQDTYLFDTTILENIAYGFAGTPLEKLSAEQKQQRVEAAAKIACAHDFITALPYGYHTTVGPRGSKLSGGQRQRISIARALVSKPKILILDEATSALDAETERSVQEALNDMTADRTTIIIAHRLSTVRQADNIVVLSAGVSVEEGTHQDLMDRRGHYFALVKAQEEMDEENSEATRKSSNGKGKEGELVGVEVKAEDSDGDEKVMLAMDVAIEHNHDSTSSPQSVVQDNTRSDSLISMARFVLQLNKEEWAYILVGLLCSIIAGFEEPASAILFGYAVVTISRPSDIYDQTEPRASFWAWMFFLLAVVMIIVFSIQGSVFAYCSERLVHRARKLTLSQMLRQEIAFFDDKRNSPGSLANFLSTEAADLVGINGGTLGMILIAISTLVSSFVVSVAPHGRSIKL